MSQNQQRQIDSSIDYYDLFVIGAGSGGLSAAKRAASYGAKVAIAERDLVGGTCVIRGCVPKKLMVYASEFSGIYQDALGYGWKNVQSSFDWQQLIANVNQEVQRLSLLHISLLEKAGVELIQGHVKFLDNHTLEVSGHQITADKILIAVGGEAVKPNLPGFEYAITSREIFHLKQQPQHIAIIGGGYVGLEFASIFNGLGSQVTQIIRGEQLLTGFDEDIRIGVREGMTKHGIKILCNTEVKQIEKVPEGLSLTLSNDTQDSLIVDTVLCATGRAPNLSELGLENIDVCITTGKIDGLGYSTLNAIAVDEYNCTMQDNIFAVGDCTDRLNLTPVAIATGRAFADTQFGNQPYAVSYEGVPSAVFSNPEAATVGLTEAQAHEKYGESVKCYRSKFRPLFHSLTGRDEKTLLKLIVDGNSQKVLGAHMVGEYAAEVIQGIAIAINMGATKKDFDTTLGIHPTVAEEFVTLR